MYFETEKIELKECLNESFSKEVEAFLNTDGGTIYIGVNDKGIPVGVKNIDEILRRISDVVSDQIEPNSIDCVKPEVVYDSDKIIIKVNVSKGFGALYCIKKYGFSSNGCHIRVGTTCKSMTLEMIRRRFEESIGDLDLMIKIPSYFQDLKFSKLKMMLLENGYHLEENSFEKNLKLRNLDGKFNTLAELLADVNSTPFIFAKFKGDNKVSFSERSDYGNQCIIVSYEKMRERLSIENICQTVTDPRPRRDIYLYDMAAVNEALINAVVHNDYRITNPQVSFFSNRLEILSHGGLPIGLSKEDFFRGISKPRNEHLMEIFTRLGIVEHTGHGIPTIIEKYGQNVFDIKDNYINVVIPFNQEVVVNHGAINGAISGVINDSGKKEMGENCKLILDVIKKEPRTTTKELSGLLSIPFRSVQRYLSNLKSFGFITRVGSNKTGYWEVL